MTEGGAVADAKRDLRARMRDVRAAVAADPADRARRSAAICDAVVATIESRLTRRARLRILLYDPLAGEPDVSALGTWCADNDVATYLPVVEGDALLIEPGDIDPTLLDVVVVPGLAFTLRWRPARPRRRALRPLPDASARRLSPHRCGVPRATRRRAADGRARRRRRRRDHRLIARLHSIVMVPMRRGAEA